MVIHGNPPRWASSESFSDSLVLLGEFLVFPSELLVPSNSLVDPLVLSPSLPRNPLRASVVP